MSNNSKKIRLSLDATDVALIFNISAGWGMNKFLAQIFLRGKSTIVDRIERLEAMGLVARLEEGVRAYSITTFGKKILKKTLYGTNIMLLDDMANSSTDVAEDTPDWLYSDYLKNYK